jgi:hypothetical protein
MVVKGVLKVTPVVLAPVPDEDFPWLRWWHDWLGAGSLSTHARRTSEGRSSVAYAVALMEILV